MIDRIDIWVFSPRLETDYIRFDVGSWYRHDKVNDSYVAVEDCEELERLFQEKLDNE